jgi:uncharacterized protein (TIGR02246 family)
MPIRMTTRIALVLMLLLSAPARLPAQSPSAKASAPGGTAGGKAAAPKAAPGKGDAEDGVRQAIAAYEKALGGGDPQAIAKFWTADGDYAGPSGRVVNARKALAGGSFDGSTPQLKLKTESLRMVTADVAQEDGICELTSAGAKPIYRGHYSAVWVRQQGNWLLSSLRETVAPPTSGRDRLAALEWLVGQWTTEDDGATITVTGNWIDNKMYLLRDIVVERDGRVIHRVSQRIAWDPLTRQIKGWTFDADGSLAESVWIRQEKSWLVRSNGATRDGQTTSARNVYSDITDDAFTLKSVDALVGGAGRPEYELHFKRVPPDE